MEGTQAGDDVGFGLLDDLEVEGQSGDDQHAQKGQDDFSVQRHGENSFHFEKIYFPHWILEEE